MHELDVQKEGLGVPAAALLVSRMPFHATRRVHRESFGS